MRPLFFSFWAAIFFDFSLLPRRLMRVRLYIVPPLFSVTFWTYCFSVSCRTSYLEEKVVGPSSPPSDKRVIKEPLPLFDDWLPVLLFWTDVPRDLHFPPPVFAWYFGLVFFFPYPFFFSTPANNTTPSDPALVVNPKVFCPCRLPGVLFFFRSSPQ